MTAGGAIPCLSAKLRRSEGYALAYVLILGALIVTLAALLLTQAVKYNEIHTIIGGRRELEALTFLAREEGRRWCSQYFIKRAASLDFSAAEPNDAPVIKLPDETFEKLKSAHPRYAFSGSFWDLNYSDGSRASADALDLPQSPPEETASGDRLCDYALVVEVADGAESCAQWRLVTFMTARKNISGDVTVEVVATTE